MSSGRIFITGGAGYVGSHTCKRLSRAGHEVAVYDDLSRGHRDFVKWGPLFEGKLQEREKLRNSLREFAPDAVKHFAASAYVGESVKDPHLYYSNNVCGTVSLLSAMREAGVRGSSFHRHAQPTVNRPACPSLKMRRNARSIPMGHRNSWQSRFAAISRRRMASDSWRCAISMPAEPMSRGRSASGTTPNHILFRARLWQPTDWQKHSRSMVTTTRHRTVPACVISFMWTIWPTLTSLRRNIWQKMAQAVNSTSAVGKATRCGRSFGPSRRSPESRFAKDWRLVVRAIPLCWWQIFQKLAGF